MRLVAFIVLAVSLAAPAFGGMRDDQRLITGARGQIMPVIEEALAAGANIEAGDAAGRTALMWAAIHGNAALVGYLIERGANVNARDRRGRSALMWAAVTGRARAAAALLAADADAALVDSAGKDAASHAAGEGHAELAEVLAGAR